VETLSGEPEHPGFHRGRFEDQRLFELLGDYDLGGGLSPDWRKRVEIDDYEIGWPEGLIRSVRLPNGYTLWMALDKSGIDVLTRYSRSTLGTLGTLIGYQVGMSTRVQTRLN
jgi:hypothetical protein